MDKEKPPLAGGMYSLPEGLARHAPGERFAPGELRGACREAGEELGWEDAREPRFLTAAQMVAMWRGLDLPAWACEARAVTSWPRPAALREPTGGSTGRLPPASPGLSGA